MPPSSSNAITNMGIYVQRTGYYHLLKIDGFLLWQFFSLFGPLKDHLDLTKKSNMHYFLRLGLKEFLEFCINTYEVIFYTTVEEKTLELQFAQLLKACRTLDK